ncbi:uncharacterized protein PGTG_17368 [Puccinia graminis f. sp. tritici CRL 75-36-700-3]|uniref:Uncharacterized protein n=1 Tax=Puccinia graminis f. sp. tritici (strain CRL 75-36-700-3 / race SCCL) TaxID=418459 RepID=E3L4D7_PUCGT|nr:uncharacterized protein PGTG_17368 [Puccinia graminis f. sp. tritici CRL 75-36-700-3]EFP91412.2 hypothetical protein PGTG_17368 [Puccinia graminis f. sp. tritici CRL 75-36-700-3]
MIEGPSSRKRKFAEDYLSDSDSSDSQASAPHFHDAMVSMTKPGSDESDHEWKERRIDYFEKFAKEKRPLTLRHDYHHPIDKNIVEKHIRGFSQLLELKKPDYSKRFIFHKKLPFRLVYHDDGRPGRQSEVLQAGSNLKQTDWAWKSLYETLVTSISEKHSEDYKMELFKKDIYISEQEGLLRWLDKEIFAPYNSLPILGLSRYSFGSEGIDEALLQPNQEKLINYFSQDAKKINTEPTVSELLKSYKHRPLKEPPETMKLPDYYSSEKNHESWVKLIEDPVRGYGLYYK